MNIAEGKKPIYVVVLSSYEANIFQFSGAIERIAGVLALHGRRGHIGVVGVDPKLVIAPAGTECADSLGSKTSAEVIVPLAIGRDTANIIWPGELTSEISLPDGTIAKRAETEAGGLPARVNVGLLTHALEVAWGGVMPVNAADVVAKVRVEDYETVPGFWGLIDLVTESKLAVERRYDDRTLALRILGPMRFPAKTMDSADVIYLLPPGIPMPLGSPGTSQIVHLSARD